MLALTSVTSALGAFSTAATIRASAQSKLIRAVPTVDQHGVESRSPLPIRQRLGEPAMNYGAGGYQGNGQIGNSGFDGSSGFERSAEARAARRDQMRAAAPPQQAPPPQSYPPQFSPQFAPPMDRAAAQPVYEAPMGSLYEPAWVLIFNEGQENEGVYTHSEQGGSDSLLAFESLDDAQHFAQVLQSKGFDLATPLHWSGGRRSSAARRTLTTSTTPSAARATPSARASRRRTSTGSRTSSRSTRTAATTTAWCRPRLRQTLISSRTSSRSTRSAATTTACCRPIPCPRRASDDVWAAPVHKTCPRARTRSGMLDMKAPAGAA